MKGVLKCICGATSRTVGDTHVTTVMTSPISYCQVLKAAFCWDPWYAHVACGIWKPMANPATVASVIDAVVGCLLARAHQSKFNVFCVAWYGAFAHSGVKTMSNLHIHTHRVSHINMFSSAFLVKSFLKTRFPVFHSSTLTLIAPVQIRSILRQDVTFHKTQSRN